MNENEKLDFFIKQTEASKYSDSKIVRNLKSDIIEKIQQTMKDMRVKNQLCENKICQLKLCQCLLIKNYQIGLSKKYIKLLCKVDVVILFYTDKMNCIRNNAKAILEDIVKYIINSNYLRKEIGLNENMSISEIKMLINDIIQNVINLSFCDDEEISRFVLAYIRKFCEGKVDNLI